MTEPRRSNWSLSGRIYLTACQNGERTYRVGFIVTAHGTVGLYDQKGDHERHSKPHTSLSFSAAGRHMQASWDRTFTDRRLKTLAERFAADCLESTQ